MLQLKSVKRQNTAPTMNIKSYVWKFVTISYWAQNLPSFIFSLQTKLMLMSHQHWNPWQLQLALRCSATKLLMQQILGVNGFYKLCTKASKWHTTILGSRKSSNFWCSTSSSNTSVPINISWKNLCIHL